MNIALRAAALISLAALAACSSGSSTMQGPILGQTAPPVVSTAPQTMSPAQTTAVARSLTDVSPFVDPGALALMSANDRNQASTAQFNALQFGRPGAPRPWVGDAGASGSVLVGPYVRVNNLDCRDYTHNVSIGGKTFTSQGMACRNNGLWTTAPGGAVASATIQ